MSAAKFADGSVPDPKRQRTGYTEKTVGYPLKNSGLAGGDQASPLVSPTCADPNTLGLSREDKHDKGGFG